MKKAGVLLVVLIIAVVSYFTWLSAQSSDVESEPVPVINVMDILHATDLEQGVKQAVQDGNDQAITEWLERAKTVGEAAELPADDLHYLTSDKARDYVIFNAKRNLFNDEFETRYYALEDIDDLKTSYPEAKDLFAKADGLLEKRDKIIQQIALTLANGQTPTASHVEQAKTLWQERYATSPQ